MNDIIIILSLYYLFFITKFDFTRENVIYANYGWNLFLSKP